jgi:hypothetical protein
VANGPGPLGLNGRGLSCAKVDGMARHAATTGVVSLLPVRSIPPAKCAGNAPALAAIGILSDTIHGIVDK